MNEKEQNIEYKLVNIEILDTEIHSPEDPLSNNTTFNFELSLEQRFNVEKNRIYILCDIITLNQDGKQQLGRIRSSCIFEVAELEKYITKDKKTTFEENFNLTLVSISISTTRGLMFSTFKGTFLQGAILPIIDPIQQQKTNLQN